MPHWADWPVAVMLYFVCCIGYGQSASKLVKVNRLSLIKRRSTKCSKFMPVTDPFRQAHTNVFRNQTSIRDNVDNF